MSWIVAINPSAGRRAIPVGRVQRALAEAGVESLVEAPPDLASMRRFLAESVTSPRVAVVGGDGTANLAVNVFLESGESRLPTLGILPAGTGSDFLRTFGIPQDLESAAHHLASDAVYTVDVGELSGSWGVRRFINVGQAGVGAAAAATAERLPRSLGAARYVTAFGLRLPGFRAAEVELTTERRTHRGKALAVIIANAQFFAGGWNVAPKATLVDGVFDLQVIDAAKITAPKLVPKIVRGLHLREPGVRRISAATFRLETDQEWPVEVDGEFIGNTPVEGTVLPAAINLKI